MMTSMIRAAAAALLLLVLACCATQGTPPPPQVASAACKLLPTPNALLSLSRCCSQDLHGNPSCRAYDREDGFIIIKDNARDKPDAYLIIPVAVVTGIEDKQIFQNPVDNFFAYGWDESKHFLSVPPAATGLAINSVGGRSQNELHIHISCIRPDVAAALAAAQIGADPAHPAQLRLPPDGHLYRAILVHGLTGQDSPFVRVAEMPGAAADMGEQSIAVVGTDRPNTYYVLDTVAGPGNQGSAEELLDQRCAGASRS